MKTWFAALLVVSIPIQGFGQVQQTPNKNLLPDDISRMYEVIHRAFEDGGETFLAHAVNYSNTVYELDQVLRSGSWKPNEAADKCQLLADVLKRTETILIKLNYTDFNRAYLEATTLLRERVETDKIHFEKSKTTLALLKSKKDDLTLPQRAQLLEAETGMRAATVRLEHYQRISTTFGYLQTAVAERNNMLTEMGEVHRHLSGVYSDLALTIRISQQSTEVEKMLSQIAKESKALQERISTTRRQMGDVLDRLESDLGKMRSGPTT